MPTILSLICLLTFGAFAGMAQRLTCTFHFTGSGTLGTHAFMDAAVTITTVGDTANLVPSGSSATINNTSASILVSGVGTFQFLGPTHIDLVVLPSNAAPGSTVVEEVYFRGSSTPQQMGFQGTNTTNPWKMLSSIGPVSTFGTLWGWDIVPVSTNGGTVNLYDVNNTPLTFQAMFTGPPPTPILSRTGVISHIAAGGEWITMVTLVNTSSAAVPVTVALYGDDGSAMTLPVTATQQGVSQTTTTSSVNATINPNATLLIAMGDQAAATVVGWADVTSTGPVGGYAIFRQTPQTGSPSEGTVPLQSQYPSTMTLPYDNTAGFVMGVAVANMSTSFASVTVTMWDDIGNQLGTQFISIAGDGHTAFLLPNQFPLTVGKRGIVQFQSSGGIAGLGLRFSPFGTFTSVPTM